MPSRIFPFVNGQFYHCYNRGSEKKPIFTSRRDYQRFIKIIHYYQFQGPKPKFSHFSQFRSFKPDPSNKIVEVISYCLMPNHFHLLLKQVQNNGITEFVSKISNSYTKYYNTKYSRVGPLLQGEFKSVLVQSDEQLLHLSRYIHLNPLVSFLVKNLDEYEWSSYKEYIKHLEGLSSKEEVLAFFKNPKEYKAFVENQADYGIELELIKHQLLEDV